MNAAEILKKPYARLAMPDEDGTFTAEIVEFPGCITSGPTMAEALANLEDVATDWIAAAIEQGQEIPEPMEAAGYSGKLVVRMAKSLHKRASLCAERDGVSLNQFIVNCIAEQVGLRARPLRVQTHPIQAMATVSIQVTGGAVSPISVGWPMPQQDIAASFENNWLGLPVPRRNLAHARG
jgi:predicted RNase H-like HicB family nuclease